MRLNIETIERSEQHYIAVACPEGSLWSEAGVGGADSEQLAAVQAVNSYFARKRDKEAAMTRPVYGSACFVSDVGSKEQTANALEFGDPHAGHPIGQPTRAPHHPLATNVSYSKIVAMTAPDILALLTSAIQRSIEVKISGTKVTGDKYVQRLILPYGITDDGVKAPKVLRCRDLRDNQIKTFYIDGIERVEVP